MNEGMPTSNLQRDLNIYERKLAKSLIPGFMAATVQYVPRKHTYEFHVFLRGDALGLPEDDYRLDVELDNLPSDTAQACHKIREILMVGVKELKAKK